MARACCRSHTLIDLSSDTLITYFPTVSEEVKWFICQPEGWKSTPRTQLSCPIWKRWVVIRLQKSPESSRIDQWLYPKSWLFCLEILILRSFQVLPLCPWISDPTKSVHILTNVTSGVSKDDNVLGENAKHSMWCVCSRRTWITSPFPRSQRRIVYWTSQKELEAAKNFVVTTTGEHCTVICYVNGSNPVLVSKQSSLAITKILLCHGSMIIPGRSLPDFDSFVSGSSC